MLELFPGALAAVGWSERVLALYNELAGQSLPTSGHPGGGDSSAGHDRTVLASASRPVRVVRVERTACFAIGPDGTESRLLAEPLPAVGDWAVARGAAIVQVLPRWSALTRVGPDPTGAESQVLAANVDLVFIAAPADRPSPARIERELAVAWDSGAQPMVVLTKADLASPGAVERLARRLVVAPVVAVSARTGLGLPVLARALGAHNTAVLLGPSGAGKSTLINAMLGTATMAIGPVRKDDGRGRHTTTWRQLVAVPAGGVLIDTPGLRSLGLAGDMSTDEVFADIAALATGCRFSDCQHTEEPGCAVNEALARGALDPDRMRSFTKLEREIAAGQRRVDPLARQPVARLRKGRPRTGRLNRSRKQV